MTLGPGDIDRWDAEQIRAVSRAARSRAESASAVSAALGQLPAVESWGGLAARAARVAIAVTQLALDAHAEESRAVARAADRAAEDVERLKSRLRRLDDDAHAAHLIVDRVTGTVIPDTEFQGDSAEFVTAADPIRTGLSGILADATAIDDELARAISANAIGIPEPKAAVAATGPEDRRTWWDSLSRAAKDLLLERNPEVLGNCDGIPTADRSRANITVMTRDIDRITGIAAEYGVLVDDVAGEPERFGLSTSDIVRYANAHRVSEGLDYTQSQTGTDVYLFAYRPQEFGGQGRTAIAIGDPDHAGHTAVVVPGTGNNVANGWFTHSDDATNLYTETLAATGPGPGVSVLAWMGYDAPDSLVDPQVSQTLLARQGGALLAADINALKATHYGPTHVTVVGHSYGATTVADAATGYRMQADDIVLVGAPGTDLARTASDFGLPAGGHVYVGSASTDPITNLAGMSGRVPGAGFTTEPIGLGADPAADGFGSTRFKAEVTGWTLGSWGDHEHYFDSGSESLFSMADIASGHGAALQEHGMTAAHRDSILGPFASRLGLPDWSIPVLDPELPRPATSGHYHDPRPGAGP